MSKKEEKDGRYTRRQFIQTAAAVAAGSTLASHATAKDDGDDKRNPPGHTDADLILENGKIHTMDAQNRVVSRVAIKNGRFLSVGEAHPGPRTKMIDLRGRTVVPGIIDNHNHMVLMGNRPGYHTPLENALSVQEALQIYAARAAGLTAMPGLPPSAASIPIIFTRRATRRADVFRHSANSTPQCRITRRS